MVVVPAGKNVASKETDWSGPLSQRASGKSRLCKDEYGFAGGKTEGSLQQKVDSAPRLGPEVTPIV